MRILEWRQGIQTNMLEELGMFLNSSFLYGFWTPTNINVKKNTAKLQTRSWLNITDKFSG